MGALYNELDEEPKSVLSSDLKDATNAQQFELTKVMIKGFMRGYGIQYSPYVELVVETIGPRLVLFHDYDSVVSSTGIMMGEAIAKPSLTLLNLCIEELSFLKYTGKTNLLTSHYGAPSRYWRFCHIGGDDHIMYGPPDYLRSVTRLHESVGSIISEEKHSISNVMVKYCERVLNIGNLQHRKAFNSSDQSKSIIVDNIKVRLLERGQSTMQKKDNKNAAIGKSSQLVRSLEWLVKDDVHWSEDKVISIRDLFISRMGPLLPSRSTHPKAFAATMLPQVIGGFGLGLSSELDGLVGKLPDPHQWLLTKMSMNHSVVKDLRMFRKLNTTLSVRGIKSIKQLEDTIIGQFEDYPNMVNAKTRKDALAPFWVLAGGNPRKAEELAAEAGILSFSEFAKRATRGNLFQTLLLDTEKVSQFGTRTFVEAYQKLWGQCEDAGLNVYRHFDLPKSNIKSIIDNNVGQQWFFDINQETAADIGPYCEVGDPDEIFDFVETTYIEKYTKGFPNLTIGKRFIGVDTNC
jgi:hypothetical protein